MGAMLRQVLKAFCAGNQWCYAVFWKIGCQNTKLLIWEECHYESTPHPDIPFGEWMDAGVLMKFSLDSGFKQKTEFNC
ncbi:hypothetical protein CUMW_216830 [Citrus unshiu]|uniref:Transcription factor MYC/MYB N-terminal domain-containing protein n=1 Tax=Citrus unshiu TaxID=55188 RepID=A0A2H5QCF7_CITUN|nr:hypothetical protein CUMW_216830 [Citrus unshiu]